MPKKKTPGQIAAAAARAATDAALEEEGAAQELLELAPEDDPEAEALEALAGIGEGSDTKFVITCLTPLDRKGKIDEVTRDDLAELWQYIRDRYGPGKYSVHAATNGQYVKGSRRVIEISPLAASARAPASSSSAAAPPADWERYLQRQAEADERRRREAREDRKDLLTLAGLVLPAIISAMSGNRESLGSLTQALANMRALSGGSEGASAEKLIEVLTRGMELGKGSGNPPETVLGVIRETVKDLVSSPIGQSVMDRIANRQALSAPAPAALPRPTVPTAPPPAPAAPASAAPAPVEGNDMMLPLLNKLADELLDFATNGCDPGLAAEALVAKVPRMARAMLKGEQLHGWLTHPDWWLYVKQFRPALEPYMGFCDDVRQALYSLLLEQGAIPGNLPGAPPIVPDGEGGAT